MGNICSVNERSVTHSLPATGGITCNGTCAMFCSVEINQAIQSSPPAQNITNLCIWGCTSAHPQKTVRILLQILRQTQLEAFSIQGNIAKTHDSSADGVRWRMPALPSNHILHTTKQACTVLNAIQEHTPGLRSLSIACREPADAHLAKSLGAVAKKLQSLDLDGLDLRDVTVMQQLADSGLSTAANLHYLDLSFCNINNDGAKVLSVALCGAPELHTLLINHNSLTLKGLEAVGELLDKHQGLKFLHLGQQNVLAPGQDDADDAKKEAETLSFPAFLNSIKRNTTLRELTLRDCNMPDDCLTLLLGALGENKGLARLDVTGNKFDLEACTLALATYLPDISLREIRMETWDTGIVPRLDTELVDSLLHALEQNKTITELQTVVTERSRLSCEQVDYLSWLRRRNQLWRYLVHLNEAGASDTVWCHWLAKVHQVEPGTISTLSSVLFIVQHKILALTGHDASRS